MKQNQNISFKTKKGDLFMENNMSQMDSGNDILAMAFVNMQPLDTVYSLSEAFRRGTLFPDLDKPLLAGGKAHDR